MHTVMMWCGLAMLFAGLCLAAASGGAARQTQRNEQPRTITTGMRRSAKLLFLGGILLWIIGALLTAGTSGP